MKDDDTIAAAQSGERAGFMSRLVAKSKTMNICKNNLATDIILMQFYSIASLDDDVITVPSEIISIHCPELEMFFIQRKLMNCVK